MNYRYILLLVLFSLTACGERQSTPVTDSVALTIAPSSQSATPISGPIQPLVLPADLNADKVALGRILFHDTRLSGDGTISCASCHAIANYGAENRQVSVGIGGKIGPINAPTVLNSCFNLRQFWDGRAADLTEQAGGPIENPSEMGAKLPEVIAKLRKDGPLNELARRAYGRSIDEKILRDAIAEYERGLVTVDSPFDQFLRGNTHAISNEAKEGWRLFRELGCVSCHQGVNVGGNLFATFGVMGDYFANRPLEKVDYGRFNVTGREEDKFRFKVPSLRNVDKTAPYFHDGRIASLEEAVEIMARTQLGLIISTKDRDAVVVFLKSLTGKLPE
ncbi:MAG: cytochrome-c peroxidase [Rhodocyclaceae bacterium]|nr:cytochrome-c peroxidase [Rhodocyclaceae bacterium]